MDRYTTKQGSYFRQIQKLKTTVNDPSKILDAQSVLIHLEKLNLVWEKAEGVNDDIIDLCKDDVEVSNQTDVFDEIYQHYYELRAQLLLSQSTLGAAAVASSSSSASLPNRRVKLPPIELPSFDGNYEQWTSFFDLFTATIDSDSSLNDSEKLKYLKHSVRGDAEKLIRSLTVTNSNYAHAWKLLRDRYNNQREIVNSILRRLFGQPSITVESADSLQQLLDTTNECLATLRVHKRPVDHWDDVIVYSLQEKLDKETRRQWAMTLTGTSLPTYGELSIFIEKHIRGLHASNSNQPVLNHPKSSNHRRVAGSHHGNVDIKCKICHADHPLFKCDKFNSATVQQRIDLVKKGNLCFNCLRSDHRNSDCTSKSRCKKCKKQHHTSLHLPNKNENNFQRIEDGGNQPPPGGNGRSITTNLAASDYDENQVLLSTAIVKIKDQYGTDQLCRLLLDSGSQATLISEHCMNKLGLQRRHSNIRITGITSSSESARGETSMRLSSTVNSRYIDITALILPRVTGIQPKFESPQREWEHTRGLSLADPLFYKPDSVDILLGADYLSEVLLQGLVNGQSGTPTAQNTVFGWVISGRVSLRPGPSVSINVVETDADKILRRFWEVEELPQEKHLTTNEEKCEKHFLETHSREEDGRFVVELPFNEKLSQLGFSRQQAVSRLKSVERRLASHPEKREQYNKFMREYEALGHMELVPDDEIGEGVGKTHYLPHHFVEKLDSETTKFRVVFDGSARSNTGVSLNDCLMVGPVLQDDVHKLLLRFRKHLIAIKGDVIKMFRQFKVIILHANFQRILWRESPELPIREYRLTTVTYGTASAPHSATRCLQQIAEENKIQHPQAAEALMEDTFMDDVMTGTPTVKEAISLQHELTDVLSQAQLQLSKWASNCSEFMSSIPHEKQETQPMKFDEDSSVKALGIQWNPVIDCFSFHVSRSEAMKKPTKRQLLSELAKVFDPLGLISPFTVRAKMLLQEIWKLEADWDDVLPNHIIQSWLDYYNEHETIQTINIPRCVVTELCEEHELHGFSDASERAYGACIYLKSRCANGDYVTRLITSNSKVAPIKQQSLPRLELCGAVMCAQLLVSVLNSMKLSCPLFGWTDSTIVLRWLAGFSGRWKAFVGNRVAKIQRLIPPEQWRHVASADNPADLCSRGVSANELKLSTLWWNGPSWLKDEQLPLFNPIPEVNGDMEERQKQILVNQVQADEAIFDKYSSFVKTVRIVALCFRFLHNVKKKINNLQQSKLTGEITLLELHHATYILIRQVQSLHFAKDIEQVKEGNLSPKSKLCNLQPFIDEEGTMRVGGRLAKADIPEQQKFPAILPSTHKLTELLIWHFHNTHLHAGFQLLWCNMQREFWILRARDVIRKIIGKCVICRRRRVKTAQQLMGNLPSARVNICKPFTNTGVDYAGPFSLRVISGRSNKLMKGYFSIFVCMATKAIHLEAVKDMTAESFIAALTRFISRRGLCANIFSDCGTNFIGADRNLQQMWKSVDFNDTVRRSINKKGILWHYNTPSSPHQGGLWEAGVKSVKHHLRRVIGNAVLTYDEFETVLCQVEACLNSRPLCAMSNDPSDLNVLTPAHFLVGEPLTAIPHPNLMELKVNRLSRWQHTVWLTQHFWKRWRDEYLSSLQQRQKWTRKEKNLQIDDLVLIKEDNSPPMQWKMGRVVTLHPNSDDNVRVVTLKTATGELQRSIHKLCPILRSNES